MATNYRIAFTNSRGYKLALAISVPLFAYLFLVFFQPFGVNNYQAGPISSELILGLLPFIPALLTVILLMEFGLRKIVFQELTLRSFVIWVLLEFVALGSTSFVLYNLMGNFHDWKGSSYLLHLVEMSSILLFPFLLVALFFYSRQIRTAYEQVLSVSSSQTKEDEVIHLTGDYKKDDIALPRKSILFLKAEDNYVGLHYLQDGSVKNYLLRSTLSKMEQVFEGSRIVRISRSIMVNLEQLESFKQDSSGSLLINLNHFSTEFKVSESKKKAIRQRLDSQLSE